MAGTGTRYARLSQLLASEQANIPVSHERWTFEAHLRY
jgi:hypothetical protein